jgi:hypothetical protein
VSPELFDLARRRAGPRRNFTRADGVVGADRVVLISDASGGAMGADPNIVAG